jgi:TolB-like protein
LVLALGYFAYDKFLLQPESGEVFGDIGRSIAVLPFVNMSDDPDNEYFADGMSEELLNLLARIPELRVISRSSAFSFKGDDIDIPAIAEKLAVEYVVEGSVRKAGNDVRITVQLIEGRSDSHVWSETYDRTLDDIFAIQDEIAAEIVGRLKIALLGEPVQSDPIDPEAYALFLQARYILNQYAGRLAQAENLLQEALTLQPDYGSALAELTRTYARQIRFGDRPEDEGKQLISETMDRALAVAPNNAAVQLYYGGMLLHSHRDYAGAARHYSRAVELAPTDTHILRLAAVFARRFGRFEAANTIGEYLIARDPFCVDCLFRLALSYRAVGRLDEADDLLRNVLIFDPDHFELHSLLGVNQLLRGNPQAALQEFDLEEDEERAQVRLLALHDLGRQAEFESALSDLHERGVDPDILAAIYAWTGDKDTAFALYDETLEAYGELPTILYEPLNRKLRDDPRWDELLEKVGKSSEQLAAIEFDVTLPN